MKVEKLFTLLFVLIFVIPIIQVIMVNGDETIIIPEIGDQQVFEYTKYFNQDTITYTFDDGSEEKQDLKIGSQFSVEICNSSKIRFGFQLIVDGKKVTQEIINGITLSGDCFGLMDYPYAQSFSTTYDYQNDSRDVYNTHRWITYTSDEYTKAEKIWEAGSNLDSYIKGIWSRTTGWLKYFYNNYSFISNGSLYNEIEYISVNPDPVNNDIPSSDLSNTDLLSTDPVNTEVSSTDLPIESVIFMVLITFSFRKIKRWKNK